MFLPTYLLKHITIWTSVALSKAKLSLSGFNLSLSFFSAGATAEKEILNMSMLFVNKLTYSSKTCEEDKIIKQESFQNGICLSGSDSFVLYSCQEGGKL